MSEERGRPQRPLPFRRSSAVAAQRTDRTSGPAVLYGEHPLSGWVCWKGVGEVGKGQMEHRRKFSSDT